MSYRDDNSYSSHDEKIVSEYRKMSIETPSVDLDKLINAAARRQVSETYKTEKKHDHRINFWNKLRLPVSFAGAMVMTFTLAHVMWPMISPQPEVFSGSISSSNNPESVDVTNGIETKPVNSDDVEFLRQKHSKKSLSVSNSEQLGNTDVYFESDILTSDAERKLTDLSPRDKWVSKIVTLAESGQFLEMNRELKSFVEQYPDYPIRDQLTPYLR